MESLVLEIYRGREATWQLITVKLLEALVEVLFPFVSGTHHQPNPKDDR